MDLLFQAAREICDFMSNHNWPFCIIGHLATLAELKESPDILVRAKRMLESAP